jgi:hypothetical protein
MLISYSSQMAMQSSILRTTLPKKNPIPTNTTPNGSTSSERCLNFMPYTNATAVGPLNAKVIVARGVLRLMLFLAAPLIALVQVPAPRADSASCLAKATLFVTELDELLEKEKEWDTPYPDLVKPYFPLRDCEAQAFLDVCRQSRFIRSTPAPTSISSGSNVTI